MPNKYSEEFEVDDTIDMEPIDDTAKNVTTMTKKERVDKTAPTTASATMVIKRGWVAAQKVQEATTPYAQRLKITEDAQIIKFIEDEPYASFRTHWVEREGQKSFICLSNHPNGCPLCKAGLRANSKFAFNVALLTSNEDPDIRSLEVGVRLIDQLRNYHNDPRQGPLSKHYWAISRTGKGAQTQTLLQLVRERDLTEFNLQALSDETMSALRNKAYSSDIIQVPSHTDLLEIASEIVQAD
jgi:hypothetical protein